MERCENCASVEAERDMAEARLKTAMYDTEVHKLNSARATTAREDALILRGAAEQALADLREKFRSVAFEAERQQPDLAEVIALINALLADPANPKPETKPRCTCANDGNASRRTFHTQADFDSCQPAEPVPSEADRCEEPS